MKNENEIFKPLKGELFDVPRGYFESLESRLGKIPEQHPARIRISLWQRLKPAVALAACIAASLIIGNAILDKGKSSFEQKQAIVLSEDPTEEDIETYLIESNVPIETLYSEVADY